MAHDNKSLGRFILDGIPPAPRGVPQIEVTFDINADGILNVSARDKATGREQTMQILPSSGLDEREIDRMVKDAERHASEDAERKASVETMNLAENAVYSAERFIKENEDKISAAQKESLNAAMDAVKSARESGSVEATKSQVDKLQGVLQEIGMSMYQQQGGPDPAAGGAPGPDGQDEDVIEGEFTS